MGTLQRPRKTERKVNMFVLPQDRTSSLQEQRMPQTWSFTLFTLQLKKTVLISSINAIHSLSVLVVLIV